MATLEGTPTNPILLWSSTNVQFKTHPNSQPKSSDARWVSSALSKRNAGNETEGRRRHVAQCSTTSSNGVQLGTLKEARGQNRYLVRGFGWEVRRMVQMGDEMRRVAQVQAEAFHEPVALFDHLFFEFFKAEVLSALIYRIRNSAPDRYACLVAEPVTGEKNSESSTEVVGVVDVTVQRDEDVVKHIGGDKEYLYVSGIAVLIKFRRRKIATLLLEACDVLSRRWGFNYLALRAYEEDTAAQRLYSKAGYRVIAGDPHWITLFGKKRRVLMIKSSLP